MNYLPEVCTKMKGIFELRTPQDLLTKLRTDQDQLRKDPTNTYLAFNFFVTAEQLKDWVYPGRANKAKRKKIRDENTLLQICSHVANGAKHFEVEASHHRSVLETERSGSYWHTHYWPGNYFASGYFKESRLIIRLKDHAEKEFGPAITALELSQRVLEFWENELNSKT